MPAQLFFINQNTLDADMTRLGNYIRKQDKVLEIQVKDAKKLKTVAQNSYFHALVQLISTETGEDFNRLRVIFKDKLGYYNEFWHEGKAIKDYKSMAKVTIKESGLFIDAAQQLCSSLNIAYPMPERHYESINYYG